MKERSIDDSVLQKSWKFRLFEAKTTLANDKSKHRCQTLAGLHRQLTNEIAKIIIM